MDRSEERAVRQRYAATIHEPLTRADVISWTRRGMEDEVIIDRVERSGTIFHLTAADENDLRDKGVSQAVIHTMQDTSRR